VPGVGEARGAPGAVLIVDRFSACWEDIQLRSGLRRRGLTAEYLDWNMIRAASSGVSFNGLTAAPSSAVFYIRSRVLTQAADGELPLVYDWLEMIADSGGTLVNRLSAIRICQNKVRQAQVLAAAGVPVPATRVVASGDEIEACLREWGTTIFKPVYGHASIDLVRLRPPRPKAGGSGLDSGEEVRAWHSLRVHRVLCAQQYMLNSGRDLRVAVIGGEIVACYWRRFSTQSLDHTVELEPAEVTADIQQLVKRAINATGVEIAAVDLVQGDDGLVVIEVNASLSLWEGLERRPGFDLTRDGITSAHADYLASVMTAAQDGAGR
jgi:tetrahydromethanopterin:alpha-L-glutamate ligase